MAKESRDYAYAKTIKPFHGKTEHAFQNYLLKMNPSTHAFIQDYLETQSHGRKLHHNVWPMDTESLPRLDKTVAQEMVKHSRTPHELAKYHREKMKGSGVGSAIMTGISKASKAAYNAAKKAVKWASKHPDQIGKAVKTATEIVKTVKGMTGKGGKEKEQEVKSEIDKELDDLLSMDDEPKGGSIRGRQKPRKKSLYVL